MTREQDTNNAGHLKVQALEWQLRLVQKISNRLYPLAPADSIALMKKIEAVL